MDGFVLLVFVLVYLGMILGRIPGLALDRTGVALLGALLLVLGGRMTPAQATGAVDFATLALLFGLMVVSAQLRLGGFYSRVVQRLAAARVSPDALLALLVATAGLLSALLVNDVVCLAMAPMLVEACARRRLDPRPFLLALALAANIGSAATLIGNPQNILVGQALRLSFGRYLLDAAVPAVAGLAVAWWIVRAGVAGRWERTTELRAAAGAPPLHAWRSTKGLLVLGAVTVLFLLAPWPRELVALGGAALLLASRHVRSRRMLGLVDWQMLVLFCALFVVHGALAASGLER
ncbi:MAG: anion transporter, partial [Deltaproteobacteria bacterium]|nr:anion transporter [Deltaproteobacteria bacterium]